MHSPIYHQTNTGLNLHTTSKHGKVMEHRWSCIQNNQLSSRIHVQLDNKFISMWIRKQLNILYVDIALHLWCAAVGVEWNISWLWVLSNHDEKQDTATWRTSKPQQYQRWRSSRLETWRKCIVHPISRVKVQFGMLFSSIECIGNRIGRDKSVQYTYNSFLSPVDGSRSTWIQCNAQAGSEKDPSTFTWNNREET